MTMPEFARGWEDDGWITDTCDNAVLERRLGVTDYLTMIIDSRGTLFISRHGDEVPIPCGNPQAAKEKAEMLMEGL